jgi:hypothetical protein
MGCDITHFSLCAEDGILVSWIGYRKATFLSKILLWRRLNKLTQASIKPPCSRPEDKTRSRPRYPDAPATKATARFGIILPSEDCSPPVQRLAPGIGLRRLAARSASAAARIVAKGIPARSAMSSNE